MKQVLYSSLYIIFILTIAGCDLITNNQNGPAPIPPGKDLIITEVFAISPDRYYSYSWINLYNPTSRPIKWVDVSRPTTFMVIGDSGAILKTPLDGSQWNDYSYGTANLKSVGFIFPDTGLAVGSNGTMLQTVDTGKTWAQLPIIFDDPTSPPLTANLNGLEYPSVFIINGQRQAWAVGDSGIIIHSVNRGATWEYQTSNTRQRINTIFDRSNANILYAGADSSVFLSTTSGGIRWSALGIPGLKFNIYGIGVLRLPGGGDTVWVVGERGFIFRSIADPSTSGPSFIKENSGVTTTLRGVHFAPNTEAGTSTDLSGSGNGWAVGDGGVILHTSNYGNSWVKQYSGVNVTLNSVHFADSLYGWVSGDAGTILSTTDGGNTWINKQSATHTSRNLYGMYFYPRQRTFKNYYALIMKAKRKFFYQDQLGNVNSNFFPSPFQPAGRLSYLYNTKSFSNPDTGTVLYAPYNLELPKDLRSEVLNPGDFAVINSDSGAFIDHTKLGPGNGQVKFAWQLQSMNFHNYFADQFPGLVPPYKDVRWSLLSSGRIVLAKFHDEIVDTTVNGTALTYTKSSKYDVLDDVRYGNYTPTTVDNLSLYWLNQSPFANLADLRPYYDSLPMFTNNISAPGIPEWSALSRYQDDVGYWNVDPSQTPYQMNSAYSFYITPDPIPRWISQLRRGH
ncbi:MAG: WD40/YVTN/BNR-like repeat-containing protein [Bacteroidota bacterium]